MAGKFITRVQQARLAHLLTGLIAALDHTGYQWNRKHKEDFELAFKALGVPCPFAMRDATPAEQKAAKPGLVERVKGALGVGNAA